MNIAHLLGVLFYVILVFLILLTTERVSRFNEFSIAGRQVPTSMVFASFAAAYIGPGFSMGFVGKGAESGFLFAIIGLVYVAQTVIVGLCLAPYLRRQEDCHTLGDFIGKKYGKEAKVLAGIICVGICISFATVMVKAGAILLSTALTIPQFAAGAMLAIITTSYTAGDGLKAGIAMGAFQFAFFALTFSVVGFFLLFNVGPDAELLAVSAITKTEQSARALGDSGVIGLFLAFLLGETLLPPYAARILSASSPRASSYGYILAGLFGIPWFLLMAYIGVMGSKYVSPITPSDGILVALSLQHLPSWLGGILFAALLAIIMSTLSALLNSGAVCFTRDLSVYFPGDVDSLVLARWITIAFAVISMCAAVVVPSLIDGLLLCYVVWAPSMLPTIIMGLFLKQPRSLAACLSILCGAVTSIIWESSIAKISPIPSMIPGLTVSLAAYGLGHLLGSKPKCFVSPYCNMIFVLTGTLISLLTGLVALWALYQLVLYLYSDR